MSSSAVAGDPARALGQHLIFSHHVLVRLRDYPAGAGMTASGLWIEHINDLPAIFGNVIAAGPGALQILQRSGGGIGSFVLFVRYTAEETDRYDDGSVYAVFAINDLLAVIDPQALVWSNEGAPAPPGVQSGP